MNIISNIKYKHIWFGSVLLAGAALYLPAVIYSLSTHFALIDDYNSWYIVKDFSKWQGAVDWFSKMAFDFGKDRFRPLFDLYNLFTWGLFGDVYQLHHLMRLLLKVATLVVTILAIRKYCDAADKVSRKHTCILVFSTLYLFFPNAPEARLAPQETLVTFFLSIAILVFLRQTFDSDRRGVGNCVIATISLVGLSCAKETAIPLSVILSFAFALVLFFQKQKKLGIFFLSSVAPFQMWAVANVVTALDNPGYGKKVIDQALLLRNIPYFTSKLLCLETSMVFGIVFLALPTLFILSHTVIRIYRLFSRLILERSTELTKRERTHLVRFVLSVLWIVSFGLASVSWTRVLRYIYPSVYLLCILVGLSMAHLRFYKRDLAALGCLLFIVLNAYNFLYQYAAQYSARQIEYQLLQAIEHEMDQGLNVASPEVGERSHKLVDYFNFYLPQYKKNSPKMRLVDLNKPLDKTVDVYVCVKRTCGKQRGLKKNYKKTRAFSHPMKKLKALSIAKKISRFFRINARPYSHTDGGASIKNWLMYKRME